MSEKKSRRRFSSEQKASVLAAHLFEKKEISDLCDEYQLLPSQLHLWKRIARSNLAAALEAGRNRASRRERQLAEENAALRAKLAKKDSVIAEISEEYVTLKKELGEP